jgi:hypothetical protein
MILSISAFADMETIISAPGCFALDQRIPTAVLPLVVVRGGKEHTPSCPVGPGSLGLFRQSSSGHLPLEH